MQKLFTNFHPNLNNKSILVTGGTGSFGKKFVEKIVKNYKPKRLVIFSRDELKQYVMSQKFSEKNINLLDILLEIFAILKDLIWLSKILILLFMQLH